MSMPDCPSPTKVAYRDEVAAKIALADITRHGDARYNDVRQVYHCRCGRWHLTSRRPSKR
jgi:hypothetical protein